MDNSFLVLKPVITEKGLSRQDQGYYCFWVNTKAKKIHIKNVVEELTGVKPLSVRTILVKGKRKMLKQKNRLIRTSDRKKAIIKFPAGTKISLIAGTKKK